MTIIKVCEFCGKSFEITGDTPSHKRRKYCNEKCCADANNLKASEKRKLTPLKHFHCSVCNKPYLTNRSDSMTCSPECRRERNRILARERFAMHYKKMKTEEKAMHEPQKPKKVTPAHEIEAEARKHGMNYGQYYALLLQKQEIEEREKRKAR